MGFHMVSQGGTSHPIDPTYLPLKNAETFVNGELVKAVNGEWTKATSNAAIWGVLEMKDDSVVGDGVTQYAVVGHRADAIFEITQSPLSDANSQAGDKCDIAASAVAVAAASNNDLQIVPDHGSAPAGKIWVKLLRRQAN